MKNYLFITPGDITQFNAHAVAYSASSYLGADGALYAAFEAHVPAFARWYAEQRREVGMSCEVGDTFWLPLGVERKPHGVVVVVSTGGGSTAEDKAAIAVRCALDTAVRRLREDLCIKGRLLVALPAFRVGMGGDRSQRLRSARVQIAAAVAALERHEAVDAAFVTYTPTLYHIFLEARRQVLGPPPDDAGRHPALEEALVAGECVLFVGAGLSRGAGLPDWGELIDRLAADLHIVPQSRFDYLDLAQWHRERFGPLALAEVVRATFHDPGATLHPTLAHYLLLSLPLRLVITTNYDDLLERSLTALKRFPIKVVRQQDVPRTGQGVGVHVVKLHGDAAYPEEIVLCRDDYDEFFHQRPAMALLLEGLLLNQTFFFVGYGLKDPNFRQIYSRITRMLREALRPAFATTFEAAGDAGTYLTRQWRHKRLHLIGVPGETRAEQEQEFLRFLDRLAEQVTTRRPRLFLAPDVALTGPLAHLRSVLVDQVGATLTTLCQQNLADADPATDVRSLAAILEFLTSHGWRPRLRGGWDLCRLWEDLAECAPDALERRRYLIAALGCAEDFGDARRVRRLLAEMEKKA